MRFRKLFDKTYVEIRKKNTKCGKIDQIQNVCSDVDTFAIGEILDF